MYSPEEANKDNTNKVNWLLYFDRKIILVIWWIHLQCKVYSGKVTSQDDTDDDKPIQGTLEVSYHLSSIRLISLIICIMLYNSEQKKLNFKHHCKHAYFCKVSKHCLSFSLIRTAISFFSKRHLCFTWHTTLEKVVKEAKEMGRQRGPSGSHHHQCINMTLTKPGTHTKREIQSMKKS